MALRHCAYLQESSTVSLALPPLRLKKNEERRLKAGHLWVYSNEIDIAQTPLKDFEPGTMVNIEDAQAHRSVDQ